MGTPPIAPAASASSRQRIGTSLAPRMTTMPTEARSRTMRAIKGRGTGPERRLAAALDGLGLAYGTHLAGLPGTPDVGFPAARLAVFVDGDFWHGHTWRETGRLPQANTAFWRDKIERNMARDVRADAALRAMGWTPLRLRERDVTRRPLACARLVRRLLGRAA